MHANQPKWDRPPTFLTPTYEKLIEVAREHGFLNASIGQLEVWRAKIDARARDMCYHELRGRNRPRKEEIEVTLMQHRVLAAAIGWHKRREREAAGIAQPPSQVIRVKAIDVKLISPGMGR